MRARHMSIRRPSLLSKHPNPANFVGCHLFPHPHTLLVPRLRPGNARRPRLRLVFQAEPVNHGGSQAGAWEPDMTVLFPHPPILVPRLRPGNARRPRLRLVFPAEPVNHGGSQAGAWEPDNKAEELGNICPINRLPSPPDKIQRQPSPPAPRNGWDPFAISATSAKAASAVAHDWSFPGR